MPLVKDSGSAHDRFTARFTLCFELNGSPNSRFGHEPFHRLDDRLNHDGIADVASSRRARLWETGVLNVHGYSINRTHRHRYFGVLAPNAPMRAVVTAMALAALGAVMPAPSLPAWPTIGTAGASAGVTVLPVKPPKPTPRTPARYLWAMLIAWIYEVFPLMCPLCAGPMRIIVFIIDGSEVRKILVSICEDSLTPRIAPARGPPLWDGHDAVVEAGDADDPQWDPSAQPSSEYQVDQRINW